MRSDVGPGGLSVFISNDSDPLSVYRARYIPLCQVKYLRPLQMRPTSRDSSHPRSRGGGAMRDATRWKSRPLKRDKIKSVFLSLSFFTHLFNFGQRWVGKKFYFIFSGSWLNKETRLQPPRKDKVARTLPTILLCITCICPSTIKYILFFMRHAL